MKRFFRSESPPGKKVLGATKSNLRGNKLLNRISYKKTTRYVEYEGSKLSHLSASRTTMTRRSTAAGGQEAHPGETLPCGEKSSRLLWRSSSVRVRRKPRVKRYTASEWTARIAMKNSGQLRNRERRRWIAGGDITSGVDLAPGGGRQSVGRWEDERWWVDAKWAFAC